VHDLEGGWNLAAQPCQCRRIGARVGLCGTRPEAGGGQAGADGDSVEKVAARDLAVHAKRTVFRRQAHDGSFPKRTVPHHAILRMDGGEVKSI